MGNPQPSLQAGKTVDLCLAPLHVGATCPVQASHEGTQLAFLYVCIGNAHACNDLGHTENKPKIKKGGLWVPFKVEAKNIKRGIVGTG